jgi:phenylalanine-4-hydroxylase
MDWIGLAQDRERWRTLENAVMKLLDSMKCGEFLDWLKTG